MSKEKYSPLFWDLYSDKMHQWIVSHPHGKVCEGKRFFHQALGISFTIDLQYDVFEQLFTTMSYQVSGPSFMIALLEALAATVVGKKIALCAHIRVDDLFEALKVYDIADRYSDEDIRDYIQYLSRFANQVMDAYMEIVDEKVPLQYSTPEGLSHFSVEGEGIGNFFELEKSIQISHLERVLEKDIRPYVQLDDGDVKIKDVTKNGVVFIEYEGNCTSCHAAGSTTLSAITQILQAKVHQRLEVLPFLGS